MIDLSRRRSSAVSDIAQAIVGLSGDGNGQVFAWVAVPRFLNEIASFLPKKCEEIEELGAIPVRRHRPKVSAFLNRLHRIQLYDLHTYGCGLSRGRASSKRLHARHKSPSLMSIRQVGFSAGLSVPAQLPARRSGYRSSDLLCMCSSTCESGCGSQRALTSPMSCVSMAVAIAVTLSRPVGLFTAN